MTVEEKQEIDNMSHEKMARIWRFSPSGTKYFSGESDVSNYFYDAFKTHGGMTTEISKKIGWE